MSQEPNRVRNILTNPEDMKDFLELVKRQMGAAKAQKEQLLSQLKQVEQAINDQENAVALCENWLEVMTENDLTTINMAYQDIKKNMTKPTLVE